MKRKITIEFPEDFRIMSDDDFLQAHGLVKAALESTYNNTDDSELRMWSMLKAAADIFDKYPETLDILSQIKTALRNLKKGEQ